MKRFTETDKWKDVWFRKLKPAEKLLWLYILDNCDNAGFFEFDPEYCCFLTGLNEEQVSGAFKGLDRGLIGAKSGDLFYVKNFLRHQKNDSLNPENNAHKQIIKLLTDKCQLFNDKEGAIKGLLSPTGKGSGNTNGNGNSKKKGKAEYTEDFESWWKAYKCKGVKADAFKNWNSAKDLPPLDDMILAIEPYLAYCKANDRTVRDGAGYITGRLWEGEWTIEQKAQPKGVYL